MPRIAKLSKNEIADILSAVFENDGYAGASLAMLAKASGLSKASLYHHFPQGKQDMAAYVLGRAGAKLQKYILAPLQKSGPGHERLLNSFEGTALYYEGDVPICLMNSLMLGEGRALFGTQVLQAVEIWQRGLAAAYKDMTGDNNSDAWATLVLERIQGALILCRLQQVRTPLEACLAKLRNDMSG